MSLDDATQVENHTYDELYIGQSARLVRTLTLQDIQAFAAVSGDTNPTHLDAEYANHTLFHGVVAHGMWGGALISALLGTEFPGPGTIYMQQSLRFLAPVRVGDAVTVVVTVKTKDDSRRTVELDCKVSNQNGREVIVGTALVLAPTEKVRRPRIERPHITLTDAEAPFKALLSLGKNLGAVRCAVVHPCSAESLAGAIEAARYGLITPVLVGPREKIEATAKSAGYDISDFEIVSTEHSHAAALRAVQLAVGGEVEILMKGSLHTDELLHAVLREPGLRTGRRLSHVFRFDVPTYSKPLLVTDAALNIAPTLLEKVDIVQNAIDFAHLLGVSLPKVAILAAVETVTPAMPATLDAAALCKMAERGQIKGGILDGPLAFDNAVSYEAARIKNIISQVAGDADILMVPNIESGNMLAKQLEYLGGASASGIVLGARCPIALTSRADGSITRVSSALLALLAAHQARLDPIRKTQLKH